MKGLQDTQCGLNQQCGVGLISFAMHVDMPHVCMATALLGMHDDTIAAACVLGHGVYLHRPTPPFTLVVMS
jgi:hypothetical protein